MPQDTSPIKLFQLFFPVKEIENIVKQSNSRAVSIGLCLWKPLTIIEAYNYIGCLIYIGIEPLRELHSYWKLATPIAQCLSKHRFQQIRRVFTLQDPNLGPIEPREPW
jgi:hypothetical protein